MSDDRLKMTVTFDVTEAQALALQAMFEYWNQLASWGSSREVAFFVDGDGNFHPKCTFEFSKEIKPLTDKFKQAAVVSEKNGDRVYDFDPVAWMLDFPELNENDN